MISRTLFLLLAILIAGPASAQTLGSLRRFLIEYRCPIVDRLEQIYDSDGEGGRDRFLVVTLVGHPHGYVQCLFADGRAKILCEVASGFYHRPSGEPRTNRMPKDAVTALARLGFSTNDSVGNFKIQRSVRRPPDLNAIADLMLKALHDAYGARAHSTLKFNAPFAPRATSKCNRMSWQHESRARA